MHQRPSYSPDYNPIEFLWKNLKRRATHNRYFPEFETRVTSVADALVYERMTGQRPDEIGRGDGAFGQHTVHATRAQVPLHSRSGAGE